MLPSVVDKMPWTDKFEVNHTDRLITIRFAPGSDVESVAIHEQLEKAREEPSFEILRKWREELYRILGLSRTVHIARGGSALFGVQTIGVHITGFCRDEAGEMKLWIPRRSATKQTYPGMLDNTVGGGTTAEEDPFECMVREAKEEASLPEQWMRANAKAVGTISYVLVRDSKAGGEIGLLQPSTQHLYDVELPADIVPKPSDGEVEAFYLLSVADAMRSLKEGQFKPNSALTLIDFLIRNGYITASNEPDYLQLVSRIHRRIHW